MSLDSPPLNLHAAGLGHQGGEPSAVGRTLFAWSCAVPLRIAHGRGSVSSCPKFWNLKHVAIQEQISRNFPGGFPESSGKRRTDLKTATAFSRFQIDWKGRRRWCLGLAPRPLPTLESSKLWGLESWQHQFLWHWFLV